MNDVQQALDLSIESYFADLARQDILFYTSLKDNDSIRASGQSFFSGAWSTSKTFKDIDGETYSIITNGEKSDTIRQGFNGEQSLNFDSVFSLIGPHAISRIDITNNLDLQDSILELPEYRNEVRLNFADSLERLRGFAKQIIISMSSNSLNFERLEGYLQSEMERKNLDVNYLLLLYKTGVPKRFELRTKEADRRFVQVNADQFDTLMSDPNAEISDYPLEVYSKSTYLSNDQKLGIRFQNASLNILKRGGVDLFISLMISMVVIGSLMYLYGIINEQKQLAEIKNDLISNITHEFKTPIATISTAIEGISNFNQANDLEKTNKYLGISKDQLKKLNGMVEKLLETASLDSNELEISKEEIEVVSFTRQLFEKYHVIKGDKSLSFQTDMSQKWLNIDSFHMENALGNLLDNAIKYGGGKISMRMMERGNTVVWEVEDNGGKIDKLEQQRIFEKFYRIPTGNVHNVKGFGIGLYYTKTLIEKHGGKIDLQVKPGSTLFSIELSNDKA